jgi:hypothetical protein
MGTIQNDAIIVTGYGDYIKNAEKKAREIFNTPALDYVSKDLVTPIMWHITNMAGTFMVAPDGSKEELDLSDEFNNRRKDFIEWLKANLDGIDWVHVTYGEIRYGIADSDDWHKEDWFTL